MGIAAEATAGAQRRVPVPTSGGRVGALRAHRARLIVTGETVLAAALGLLLGGHRSLWLDEAYSWSTANRTFSGVARLLTGHEPYDIPYSLTMWAWGHVGQSEAMLRVPSAVFVAAAVPVVYLLGRRLVGERVGLLAGLLLPVNAVVLEYAQTARAYTLAVLLGAISAYCFAGEVLRPTRRTWIGWVLATVLLVYDQSFAVLILAGQAGSLVFLPAGTVRRRRLLAGAAVIGALLVPLAVFLSRLSGPDPLSFLHRPGLRLGVGAFWKLSGRSPLLLGGYFVAGLATLVLAWRVLRRAGRSEEVWRYAYLLCWLFVPIASLFLIAQVKPVFQDRYLLYCLPALALLVAIALDRLGSRRALVVATLVLLLLPARELWQWYAIAPRTQKEDFRAAVAHLRRFGRAGDGVLFVTDEGRVAVEYYLRDAPAARRRLVPAYPARPWGTFRTGDQRIRVLDTSQMNRVAQRFDRLWVVRSYVSITPNKRAARSRFAQLDRSHELVWHHGYGRELSLRLYRRSSTSAR
jgi:mannosyltransferase